MPMPVPQPSAVVQMRARTSTYLVGQDGEGHWVAVEAKGLAGGLFRTRQDAIRYACLEAGCRPEEVALAAGPVRVRLAPEAA